MDTEGVNDIVGVTVRVPDAGGDTDGLPTALPTLGDADGDTSLNEYAPLPVTHHRLPSDATVGLALNGAGPEYDHINQPVTEFTPITLPSDDPTNSIPFASITGENSKELLVRYDHDNASPPDAWNARR